MESYTFEWDMPLFGHVKFVTALVFDVGVYLIVVGLVLDILRSLGGRIDERIERAALEASTQRSGRGSRIRLTRKGSAMSATRSESPDLPAGSMASGDETSEVRP